MPVLAATPLLPAGARTWGVESWPSWPTLQRMDALGPFLDAWGQKEPTDRQADLRNLLQTTGLLLGLAGVSEFRRALAVPTEAEGFDWMLSSAPLPWTWGLKPLVRSPGPPTLGQPWDTNVFLDWLAGQPLPEDSTGTWASLAWFHGVTGLLAWWDARQAARLGCGFRTGDLDLGVGPAFEVVCTGRRFGPSLSRFP